MPRSSAKPAATLAAPTRKNGAARVNGKATALKVPEPPVAPVVAPAVATSILGAYARAPRAMWKGSITYSVLSIPVSLYLAADSRDIQFSTLHASCKTHIKTKRFCPACDNVALGEGDTVKGYEYAKDSFIEVTPDELDNLPVPSRKAIALDAFIPAASIDAVYFEKTYRVQPEPLGQRPYALLLHTLRSRNVAAVARVTLRTREALCLLRATPEGIALVTLYYQDEVRAFPAVPEVPLAKEELALCDALVEVLSQPFDPGAYRDTYRDELLSLIESKVNHGPRAAAGGALPAAPTTDLMAALKASLAEAKKRQVAA